MKDGKQAPPGAAKAANHIAGHFDVFGLLPMDELYPGITVNMSTLTNPPANRPMLNNV